MGWSNKFANLTSRAALRELIAAHFSLSELQDLCYDLEIDWEDLPGPEKSAKVRGLLAYVVRHGRITDLCNAVLRLRPNLTGPSGPPPTLADRSPLPTPLTSLIGRRAELEAI
jgi:hypothetical protein